MDVPVGEGVGSDTFRTIKRRSTAAAGFVLASPAVAVVATRPDGALTCRPKRASRHGSTRARCLTNADVVCLVRTGVATSRTADVIETRAVAPYLAPPACVSRLRRRTSPEIRRSERRGVLGAGSRSRACPQGIPGRVLDEHDALGSGSGVAGKHRHDSRIER
jgi:hypothetical protein